MFRKYPYWAWLLISITLWVINGLHFHAHRQELLPETMAEAVKNDLQQKEKSFNTFINNKDLLRRIYTDSLTEKESIQLNHFAYFIYAYNNDTLVYWNTNKVIGNINDSIGDKSILIHNDKGVFLEKCCYLNTGKNSKKIVVLFPIYISYPLENEYLKSHFVASEYIPVKTKIVSDNTIPGLYAIKMLTGNTVFYLNFNQAEIQKWIPNDTFLYMLFAAIFTSIFWIQLMINYITRKKSAILSFIITLLLIIIFRLELRNFETFFNLDTLAFFSPRLYASNVYLSSLGDLFLNTMFVLWMIIFITRHTPYKTFFVQLKNALLKTIISVGLIVGLMLYILFFTSISRSLVTDSEISFDVSHFYAINIYSILGLATICTITGISCMIIYLFNTQLIVLIKNKWLKYGLIMLISFILILLIPNLHNQFSLFLFSWLLVTIVLLDIRNFTIVSDLFKPHMIFWAIYICTFNTCILQYFSLVKERDDRKTFVEQKLTPQRDNILEYAFVKTAEAISKDKILKNYFTNPSIVNRKTVNQRFDVLYLNGPANKYQSRVYLFDSAGEDLYNKDTTDYPTLLNEKNESATTVCNYLFYKESILDRHYYLSYIPITDDSEKHILGYVIIDLDLKKRVIETVYPELLQPPVNQANTGENEYAYAIYVNDKLITQTNNYPFNVKLDNDTLKEQQYVFYENNNITELYYKISNKRTVVVVHYHKLIYETITLFSYLFGIQVLLALIILIYQLFLSYFNGTIFTEGFIKLTLRRRIHFSMLAVVLLSFIIIGTVTIIFFTIEYKTSNTVKLETAMQVVKQSVQDYLKKENAFDADYLFDSVSKSKHFKYFINNLASNQKIDINIFDDKGNLFTTSQDDIFDKGLISRKIRPDAFFQLGNKGKSLVIQDEQISGLKYLAAYQPLRDDQGVTLGYVNVPFFSSEKDLKFQISNIVVTLINLYAFIFLMSSIITVIITRWIIRTFNIITRQFERINLQKNERIVWPYDDEIGKLVSEYNNMVKKVEENAILLAQSERESAWREMARQVAHEIKNPLTPMKLNIQYLQKALNNNQSNIKELGERVSNSIIEQIDNLSYIASEFSNFAKMPEAKPETIELGALLNRAIELYINDEELKVTFNINPVKLFVVSDKSQLLRVFTNLLENAKQAIPNTRQGIITVSTVIENEYVIISIADNGNGIPEEVVSKIFHPYFTTKSSGTGLGLAMTKKIIEFWKGQIWFETKINEGTTFYIKMVISG